MVRHYYEFWCTDVNGKEYHERFTYSSTKDSMIRAHIEKVFKLDIGTCIDFMYRRNREA